MNIYVNSLVHWNNSGLTDRVLFNDGRIVVTIDIFATDALPEIHPYSEIVSAFNTHACRIIDKDPFDFILVHESSINQKSKLHRDQAWSVIEEIVKAGGLGIFNGQERGAMLKLAAKRANIDIGTVYRYVRRFWQWGLTKNALLPRYSRCGGKGKPRLGKAVTDKKLGKPSALSSATEQIRGIRLTEEVCIYFRLGLERFYKTQQKQSLNEAYQRTLETFFHAGLEFQGDVLVPVMPSANKLPSFAQFKYFYYSKYYDPVGEVKARNGKIDFLLNYRELTGNSTDMAFGPGSVFQVDATIADVYLLSVDRRKIIGRPVVYIVIDVFSRLIVGISVILEGPSWLGGMLALDNTFSNKVQFCAEYGIEISEEQWPSHHLPKAILADRGEFEGYNVETITSAFGVTIYNAPPYRADYKGIVERQFRTLNEKFVSFVPGFVYKHRDRGDPDYRLDAVLTLKEFTTLMIAHVLNHKQNRHLTTYRKDEIMILDEVSRYPVDLWKWGMENRSGHLREVKRDVARMNLLPRKEISLTPQGLHLERELYYSCDSLVASGLMMRKRGRTYPRIIVAYDPRNIDQVYIPSSDGTAFTICPLTSAAKSYLGLSLYDAQYYFNEETQNNELAQSQQIQSRAQFNAVSEHITSKALEETVQIEERGEPISKAERLRDIRKNRAAERQAEREKTKWSVGEGKTTSQLQAADSERTVDADKKQFIKPVSNASTIRSIRNKKRENK